MLAILVRPNSFVAVFLLAFSSWSNRRRREVGPYKKAAGQRPAFWGRGRKGGRFLKPSAGSQIIRGALCDGLHLARFIAGAVGRGGFNRSGAPVGRCRGREITPEAELKAGNPLLDDRATGLSQDNRHPYDGEIIAGSHRNDLANFSRVAGKVGSTAGGFRKSLTVNANAGFLRALPAVS